MLKPRPVCNLGFMDTQHAERRPQCEIEPEAYGRNGPGRSCNASELVDTLPAGRTEGWTWPGNGSVTGSGGNCGLAYADGRDTSPERKQRSGKQRQFAEDRSLDDLPDSPIPRCDEARQHECHEWFHAHTRPTADSPEPAVGPLTS
jgi:hypothetical protein